MADIRGRANLALHASDASSLVTNEVRSAVRSVQRVRTRICAGLLTGGAIRRPLVARVGGRATLTRRATHTTALIADLVGSAGHPVRLQHTRVLTGRLARIALHRPLMAGIERLTGLPLNAGYAAALETHQVRATADTVR